MKGIRSYFSLDLSAATDRLPISLQKEILNRLIPTSSKNFGDMWGNILVNRDYHLKDDRFDVDQGFRYSVGQPMGALSS